MPLVETKYRFGRPYVRSGTKTARVLRSQVRRAGSRPGGSNSVINGGLASSPGSSRAPPGHLDGASNARAPVHDDLCVHDDPARHRDGGRLVGLWVHAVGDQHAISPRRERPHAKLPVPEPNTRDRSRRGPLRCSPRRILQRKRLFVGAGCSIALGPSAHTHVVRRPGQYPPILRTRKDEPSPK